MKIAVVLDTDLDQPDGVQQCVLTLNDWLSAQGHEIHYIVGETRRTDRPNIHVAARNISVKFNGNKLTMPLPTAQRKLNHLLAEIQPDVLHVHTPYSPFMGAKAIKAAPQTAGIVGTFHVLPYGFVARYGTRLLGVWLRTSLKRFDALYAGTPAAAQFAQWAFGIPTGVLPHAVAVEQFQAARQPRKFAPASTSNTTKLRIVFLGRLVQRKGALQLVQAVAGLPKTVQDSIEVHIGGRGAQAAEIGQLIKDHTLDCVQLDGFISEADKPAYLAAADIAIFPSIAGESFGISLIEPLAAGAGVVVGGNNPGYQAILGDWPETLFDPRDVPAFTRYLSQLIQDAALRARIHGWQQPAVGQYDVNVIGQRWLQIYADAVAAHGTIKT